MGETGRSEVDRGIAAYWIVTLLFVAATLVASRFERRGPEGVAKAAASVGFLATALHAGALETEHGQAIFVGLGFSWFGDVFLLSKARPWFLAGLVSFLLGHVAYVVSFGLRGVDPTTLAITGAAVIVPALVVWRWLRGHVGTMRGPVIAYITIISLMLAFAAATTLRASAPRLMLGAFAFYVSDLFVARHRFVQPAFVNRLIGLPVYYVAQLLLATFAGA